MKPLKTRRGKCWMNVCLLRIHNWRPNLTFCSLLEQSQPAYSICLIYCYRDAHLWRVVVPLTDWGNWDQTGSAGNQKKTSVRLHIAQQGTLSALPGYLKCLLQSFFHSQNHIYVTKARWKTNCCCTSAFADSLWEPFPYSPPVSNTNSCQ